MAQKIMEIGFHKKFKKKYKKLPKEIQEQFDLRLGVFLVDPSDPLLHVHSLKGKRSAYSSMNITGDYRALFIKTAGKVTFMNIGTHSELYG